MVIYFTILYSSETGHVLTIMKAGDFFGEIGILNLDGFNKYVLNFIMYKKIFIYYLLTVNIKIKLNQYYTGFLSLICLPI